MKSDRRHELKSNALDSWISRVPRLAQEHGGKILAVVIVLILGVVFLRQRISASHQKLASAMENLTSVRQQIQQLRNSPYLQVSDDQEQTANLREQIYRNATATLDAVSSQVDDAKVRGEALICAGDLNWQMAHLASLPGAATRPTLNTPLTAAEHLKASKDAYQDALNQYSDQPWTRLGARFGLAAIAEDEHDWGQARQMYQNVLDDAQAGASFTDLAKMRLANLPELQKPVYLAPVTQPVWTAATAPSSAATTAPQPAAK